jgi:glycosyltransferase involved in cell wall biosynthesis
LESVSDCEKNVSLPEFIGKLGLQQRVIPAYRAPFFEALGRACRDGLSIFAGQPLPIENIQTASRLEGVDFTIGKNRHLFDPGSPFYQCWQPGLLAWLEAQDPDMLIVEANPRYPTTHRAISWMHGRKRKVLGWGLGAPPLSGFLAGWRHHNRLKLLSKLDGIIAYSQRGAQEYQALGLPASQVFVAPNAATFRPQQPPPHRPGVFTGRPKVLFVGRLQARKRVALLLEACSRLPEEDQPDLWIVGEGPASPHFKEVAERLYPRATFTGELHGEALEPYLARADLFVLPGTGGLAVQQAMAHGLPVIVAQGDGTQDDLVRAENGWRVPPGDVNELHHALESALSDPQRLRRMGDASYRIVAHEINLEAMLAAFVQAASAVQPAD